MSRYVFADRSFIVDGASKTLERCLKDAHPGASWNDVRRLVQGGKVCVNGRSLDDPRSIVAPGATLDIAMNRQKSGRRGSGVEPTIVHLDSQVIVVEKPAGLSTVPYLGEGDSLEQRVRRLLQARNHRAPLHVVHRLDKETSGLLVFARTKDAERHLSRQWRRRSVRRQYWAIVHGTPGARTIQSLLADDRGDGRRGSTRNPALGKLAITHVELLKPCRGAALVRCRLETGRTHQIRIHLAEAGHPLLGERVYLDLRKVTPLSAPRVMLHATTLGFEHPTNGTTLDFESRLPEDMRHVLEQLCGAAR